MNARSNTNGHQDHGHYYGNQGDWYILGDHESDGPDHAHTHCKQGQEHTQCGAEHSIEDNANHSNDKWHQNQDILLHGVLGIIEDIGVSYQVDLLRTFEASHNRFNFTEQCVILRMSVQI